MEYFFCVEGFSVSGNNTIYQMMRWCQYHHGVMKGGEKNSFQHQKSLILELQR